MRALNICPELMAATDVNIAGLVGAVMSFGFKCGFTRPLAIMVDATIRAKGRRWRHRKSLHEDMCCKGRP